jgi:hypothetical protein
MGLGHGLLDGLVGHRNQALLIGQFDFHVLLDHKAINVLGGCNPQFLDLAVGNDSGILDLPLAEGLSQLDFLSLRDFLLGDILVLVDALKLDGMALGDGCAFLFGRGLFV